MANTLKFGNGEWYGKKDTILAYNDENYNYKPLPFSFDRASSGTVVNKAGLIETVGSGEPRIDYSDDANGALLLEPQRTNLILNSEDIITGWSTINTTVQNNQTISPDGTLNAALSTTTSTVGSHASFETLAGVLTAGSDNYISCFVKKSTTRYIRLNEGYVNDVVTFDLDTQTFVITQGSPTNIIFEDYGNGWYRIGYKFVADVSGNTQFVLYINDNNNNASYGGNGEAVYIYGAQLEEGSYPTSYIPTQGSAVTRLEDTCTNGGNEQVINSTEGVLYAEISALALTGVDSRISLSNKTLSNRVSFAYSPTASKAYIIVKLNSTTVINNLNVEIGNHLDTKKIAISYKSGDTKVYLNGSELLTSSVSFTGGVLNDLSFESANGSVKFYGNTKDVRVYNTALTDNELQQLTTI